MLKTINFLSSHVFFRTAQKNSDKNGRKETSSTWILLLQEHVYVMLLPESTGRLGHVSLLLVEIGWRNKR